MICWAAHWAYGWSVTLKWTMLHHLVGNSGSWPFGLRLGDASSPDLLSVEITAQARFPAWSKYSAESQLPSRIEIGNPGPQLVSAG